MLLDYAPGCLAGHAAAETVEEDGFCIVSGVPLLGLHCTSGCGAEPLFQSVESHAAQWDDALFGTFAEHSHETLLAVYIAGAEVDELRDSQSCSVEEFKHCSVAEVGWLVARCGC